MPTPEEIQNESRRFMCALLSDADAGFNYVARRTNAFPLVRPLNRGAANAREALRNAFCQGLPPEPRPGDDFGTPPFNGGQCEVQYAVDIEAQTDNSNIGDDGLFTTTVEVIGPILGLEIEVQGGSNSLILLHGDRDGEPFRTFLIGGGLQFEGERILDVRRLDGQPDDCGSPPGEPPEYDGPIGPPIPNPDDPDGPPIDPPPGRIVPGPPIDRGPTFPIIIPIGYFDNDLNVDFNFDVDVNVRLGGGCCPPRRPNLPPEGDRPPEGPENPEDPDPPDTDDPAQVVVGAIIKTTRLTEGATTTTVFGDGQKPDLYLPRCASVVFALTIEGVRCWTKPIDVETLSQYVPAVGDVFPYDAKVKPMPGYSSSITLVYAARPLPNGEE